MEIIRPSGYALQLGDTKYVNCGNIVEMNATPQFTIESWIRYNSFSGAQGLWSKNSTNIMSQQASGNTYMWFAGGASGVQFWSVSNTTSRISVGQWIHMVWTFNGFNVGSNARMYFNNVSYSGNHVGYIVTANAGATNFILGAYSTNELNGDQSIFRLWKICLSATQVRNLYNRGAGIRTSLVGRKGWDDGLLVTEYLFTDGSGTTVTDTTGNYNGTTVGSPSWIRT